MHIVFKKANKNLDGRFAVLYLAPQTLVAFMSSQRWVITKGYLPDDVVFHHVYYLPERQLWGAVCQSAEFKQVLRGAPLPELPPVEFRYYNPVKDGIIE